MNILKAASLASLLLLGGCYGYTPLGAALPNWPAECRQVTVKDPVSGEDKLSYAARERAGRIQANNTIAACAGWYSDVKAFYGGLD